MGTLTELVGTTTGNGRGTLAIDGPLAPAAAGGLPGRVAVAGGATPDVLVVVALFTFAEPLVVFREEEAVS